MSLQTSIYWDISTEGNIYITKVAETHMKARFILVSLLLFGSMFIVHAAAQSQTRETQDEYYVKNFVVNGDEPEVFKLMAYNIRETGANPAWKDIVKAENPDILVAVETGKWDGPDDGVLRSIRDEFNEFFADEVPYEVWATTDNPSGTAGEAIFSRYPIINGTTVATLTLDDGSTKEAHNPFMDAVVNISGTVTHIFGVHLKCCDTGTGIEQQNREQDTEGILNYMDQLGDVPIIYAGDLNSFHPFDVKVLNSGDNLGYGPLEIMLNSSNPRASQVHQFIDVYRELNPLDLGYTFVDDFYQSRIDFIIVNQYFFEMLINSTVSTVPGVEEASDHFPVNAWFNLDPDLADLRPPARVYHVKGNLNNGNVQLLWDPSDAEDLSNYTVYRNGTVIGVTNVTTFTDDSVSDNTVYDYQVSATDNSSNEGFKSYDIYVNTSYGMLTPPSEPLNVVLEPGVNQLTLRWEKPASNGGTPIIGYNIYRSTSPTGIFIIWGSTKDTEFTDNNTISAFNYYYKVAAVNVIGESNRTEMVSGKPFAPNPTKQTSESSSPIGWLAILTPMIAVKVIIRKQKTKF